MKTRITIEDTSPAIQAYSREIRSGIVTLEWQGVWGYSDPTLPLVPYAGLPPAVVRDNYAALVYPFSKDPAWHEARLKTCRETVPGTWEIEVELPYLD